MHSDHELQLRVGRWMTAAWGHSIEAKQAGMWGGGDADGNNKSVKHQWSLWRTSVQNVSEDMWGLYDRYIFYIFSVSVKQKDQAE